jgi:hypothetical protein
MLQTDKGGTCALVQATVWSQGHMGLSVCPGRIWKPQAPNRPPPQTLPSPTAMSCVTTTQLPGCVESGHWYIEDLSERVKLLVLENVLENRKGKWTLTVLKKASPLGSISMSSEPASANRRNIQNVSYPLMKIYFFITPNLKMGLHISSSLFIYLFKLLNVIIWTFKNINIINKYN